jgi:hypothetical protein
MKIRGFSMIERSLSPAVERLPIDIHAVAGLIADTQLQTGEIPWSPTDKTDPWDHVESAMGLVVGGLFPEARRAFEWLAEMQLENGSWYAAYRGGEPEDRTQDSNQSSYMAVGMFHYYLVSGDVVFLRRLWPVVRSAVDFAVGLQAPGGEIHWALNPEGRVDPMALLTGSSSVYMSIKCGLELARIVGDPVPSWQPAMDRLRDAICHKPHHFNMTKSRYAMDWFYPVLTGAVTGDAARQRIDRYWKKFMVEGQGVRCVSDHPWVTIAETSELCLALNAMGNHRLAEIVFNWICDKRYDDGSYWCGHTYPDMTIWPEDKITWTNAVVLMAADALYGLTPAAGLFSHSAWGPDGFTGKTLPEI